jgi:hypothetical protein
VLALLPMVVWLYLGSSHLAIHEMQASSARGELRRTPLGRNSQYSTSRHSGEAFSKVPHPPKLGHIVQTVNARGLAYTIRYTLQPLVARQS